MKRVTFKGLQKSHPEFILAKEGGHISITHKDTGKKVVCIVGDRMYHYNDFLERVKANPESYLNNSSYFRHTEPTCEDPYQGKTIKVTATEWDLVNHFGRPNFTHQGEELQIENGRWSDLSEHWVPQVRREDGTGFWLRPDMVEIL
jgi:hypothetical protein